MYSYYLAWSAACTVTQRVFRTLIERAEAMVRDGGTRTLLKYLLVQIPGWTVAMVLAWMFHRLYALPWWAGLLLVGLWIAKDLALYPSMRPFYESKPTEPRIVGDAAITVTDLAPRGFVRVYGELWQAEAVGGAHIPDGFTVCVRDIRGLLLIVEPVPAAVHERDTAERS